MANYGDELKKTGEPVPHPTGGVLGGPLGAEHPPGAEHPHGAPTSVPPTTGAPHHKDTQPHHEPGYGGVPGHHKDTQPHHEPGYGGVPGQPEPEKKGMVDKIKEKLPGGHHN